MKNELVRHSKDLFSQTQTKFTCDHGDPDGPEPLTSKKCETHFAIESGDQFAKSGGPPPATPVKDFLFAQKNAYVEPPKHMATHILSGKACLFVKNSTNNMI